MISAPCRSPVALDKLISPNTRGDVGARTAALHDLEADRVLLRPPVLELLAHAVRRCR